MKDKWQVRFELVRTLAWLILPGFALITIALWTSGLVEKSACVAGILLLLPPLVYTYIVTIWHWKSRYRGKHSDLWGAVLLLEASGWMKIVYLFRHLIPDMRQTGRYRTDGTIGNGAKGIQNASALPPTGPSS